MYNIEDFKVQIVKSVLRFTIVEKILSEYQKFVYYAKLLFIPLNSCLKVRLLRGMKHQKSGFEISFSIQSFLRSR